LLNWHGITILTADFLRTISTFVSGLGVVCSLFVGH